MARGDVVLFTGAGFSADAVNIAGAPMPSVGRLRELLWELCFPGTPYEEGSSLQDLYEDALRLHVRQLTEFLQRELSVDSVSLPSWYEVAFTQPWYRVYTLNVDDLELAVQRRFALPRRIAAISARADVPQREAHGLLTSDLEVVHLNGTLDDLPDRVTFSLTQYAERLASHDPWYSRVTTDLVSHPFVFVGTRLDEPPLWQHVQLRSSRGARGLQELRPRSYLVTPHLDRARRGLLEGFNVHWVEASAAEFFEVVRTELAASAAAGLAHVDSVAGERGVGRQELAEVAALAASPAQQSDFLLGQEPIWADLQSGRAARREVDDEIHRMADELLSSPTGGLLLLSGTAGSGKSTSLMREALRLTAEGRRVAWIDRESDITIRSIRDRLRAEDPPGVLAVDDGETFGAELAPLVRDLVTSDRGPLVIAAVRSGRVDAVLNPARLANIQQREISMPGLENSDIDAILDILEQENRLGVLRGLPRHEQQRIFREEAGRQLLVAMIQATSGRPFEEKVIDEFFELEPPQKIAYALVVVASALGYSLAPDEVLLASGDRTNTTLNALNRLRTRRVLVSATGDERRIRARHRVVATILLEELRTRGQLVDVMRGLALVAATKVSRNLSRSARPWRFLKRIISHDFLMRVIGVGAARDLYGSIEQILDWDYHFWLQRGSLEVQVGNVDIAENFLGQARALDGGDPYVETAWAYLLFKQALANPRGIQASDVASSARAVLEQLIRERGHIDSYPFHVLGSQGLAWARRGILNPAEREPYLRSLVAVLEEGVAKHPRVAELSTLLVDVRREYLSLAVGPEPES